MQASNNHAEILSKVRERLRPSPDERARVENATKTALERLKPLAERYGFKPVPVGSAARDTWLPGRVDIDIFLIFPKDLTVEELRDRGLKAGIEISKGKYKLRYASHPYVTVWIEGFWIDMVPCFEAEIGEAIKSAVDRTPLHHQYLVRRKIVELGDEVRLLKSFLLTLDAYGAEAAVQGFSGYLCELLILHARTFLKLLSEASGWKEPTVIDLEDYWGGKKPKEIFQSPLIVIDPVDWRRNVAAALSRTQYYKFKAFSRLFLKKPSPQYFHVYAEEQPRPKPSQTAGERGTYLYAVLIRPPGPAPEIMWTQLAKLWRQLKRILEGEGFKVIDGGCWTDTERIAVALYELDRNTVPRMLIRKGPRVGMGGQEDKFLEKWTGKAEKGPYISGDRWYIGILRSRVKPEEIILYHLTDSKGIAEAGIPSHVKQSILSYGVTILTPKTIDRIVGINRELDSYLSKLLHRRPPLHSRLWASQDEN